MTARPPTPLSADETVPRDVGSSTVRSFLVGGLVIGALLLVGGVVGGRLFDWNLPFGTETKDHSPPPILTEIRDVAEFHAAEAELEVIVDREKDVKWVPSFIAGERVQYVAVGTVDAIVDFSALTSESIVYDAEENRAVILLPDPVMVAPRIDLDRSGVMNRDRGVLDRVGGMFTDNPTAEQGLLQEAEDKMVDAAAQSDLLERARENTEKMLQSLLGGVGVDTIQVVFTAPSAT